MRSLHGWSYVDPKHEALMLATLKTTSCVGLDYERAVALASVAEGAARSVLKVTQVEPSRGW